MHAVIRGTALAAFGIGAIAAGPVAAQEAGRDSLPLLREVVRAIHVGLESQRGAPWFRDSPVLLVHAVRPPGGRWGTDEELVPPLRGVRIRACAEGCAAERPAEIRLTFLRIGYRGDRHTEVEVEATGMHGKHRDVPAHPWRSLTLYRLELHGGEWIAVRAEPILGS